MNTPSPYPREPHRILRLIGALIIATGGMLLLNLLFGPTPQAGSWPDERYQRIDYPNLPLADRSIET